MQDNNINHGLPAEAQEHLAQAQAYVEQSQLGSALRECDAALRLAPKWAKAHLVRGTVLEKLGYGEPALKAYREAVRLDPDLQRAWDNLCEIEGRINETREQSLKAARSSAVVEGKNFGQRAVAYVIDQVAIFALQWAAILGAGVVVGALLSILGQPIAIDDQSFEGTEFIIISLLFSVLYFTVLETWFGATLGKFFLGMRVVKTDGRPCDLKAAFIRAIFRLPEGLFAGIPAATSMKEPLHQRYGDRAADTVVTDSGATFIQQSRRWPYLGLALVLYFVLVMSTMGMVIILVNTGEAHSLPDMAEVTLTMEDFPQPFLELDPERFGLQVGQRLSGNLQIDSAFGLLSVEPFEMIWGVAILLPNEDQQADFDRDLGSQDVPESFVAGLSQQIEGGLEQMALLDLEQVGDASMGLTVVIDTEEMEIRMDVLVFRREMVGAIVYTAYEEGESPMVGIEKAARQLDARIVEAIRAAD